MAPSLGGPSLPSCTNVHNLIAHSCTPVGFRHGARARTPRIPDAPQERSVRTDAASDTDVPVALADAVPLARFTPRRRRQTTNSHDRANLDAELALIRARIDTVTARGREDFHDGKETYDVACMVIIRLAALLERPEFEPHMEAVTRQERLAIRTTRNIAAHTGYRSINDDLFWLAVTQRVPAILDRLRGQ